MGDGVKGTVTPLASIFSSEEAQKASKRVEDFIAERETELEILKGFISDNTALVNLVGRLPEELSHDIMVPFGKAAFFPGRLIHTNEFMVLLGEGYYAERTSKQTIEILQRREKVLESQVDSLKAMMLDLKAEASFFDATASEAAEGLVEIREEYVEEQPLERTYESGSSEAYNVKVANEDEEYSRIMARLDELEKEELAASRSDEDEDNGAYFGFSKHQPKDQLQEHGKLFDTTQKPSNGSYSQPNQANNSTLEDLKVQVLAKDESSDRKSSRYNMQKSSITEKSSGFPESTEKARAISAPKSEEKIHAVSTPELEKVQAISTPQNEDSDDNVVGHTTSKMVSDRRKAFTGSIIEHSHGLPSNPTSQSSTTSQVSSSNPSKPVSRFKMQKGR